MENKSRREVKVRLCIHSDINNDDESREVEQRGTKLRAGFFWVVQERMQHFCRHTVRGMSSVCVRTPWPRYTHRIGREILRDEISDSGREMRERAESRRKGGGWVERGGAAFACDAKNKTCRAAFECALEQTFI